MPACASAQARGGTPLLPAPDSATNLRAVHVVLGTHHLIAAAGSDTYLMTVAEQLQRLSHEVTIYALDQGEMADLARRKGLHVTVREPDLPEAPDAVLSQDTVTAYQLAEQYPHVTQVFVCHSDLFGIDTPPQLPGATGALVVMSERVRRHVESLAVAPEIVRLRQPIDLHRFSPNGAVRERPRKVVAIGNYLTGPRRQVLVDACRQLGLELSFFGTEDGPTEYPEDEMARADIVVGKSRVVLEAMACGRAAYVFDFLGSDGWITPDSYPRLEADAFLGRAGDQPVTAERVREELGAYEPGMAMVNRDLALAHHDAVRHVQELVALFRRLAEQERGPLPDNTPLAEMAMMSRRQWLLEAEVHHLRDRLLRLEGELAHQHDRSDKAEELTGQALAALEEIKRSRRYRLAERLVGPLERLRRRQ